MSCAVICPNIEAPHSSNRRTVQFQARGMHIPPFVNVDVGEMGLEQVRSCNIALQEKK
jgi:hypothetical protein